jgi:protease-4
MKRAFAVFAIISLLGGMAVAEDVGDLALKQGIGVRAAGMGGAFSAIADDASAVFYNPAGLAEIGIGYTYGSLDSQQINSEFNYSLLKLGYLGYSEGKVRDLSGKELSFSAFGFGNRSGWLNWGTNYKALTWNLTGVEETGWSADIAFLMRLTPRARLALVAQDILTTKERIVPASARVGFSFKPLDGQVVIAGDAEIYKSTLSYGHFGVEAAIANGLTFRGGIDRSRPTVGASLDLAAFSLDYALLFPQDGRNIQRFEAGFKFQPQRERPFSLIKPKEFALIDIGGAVKGGQTELSLIGGFRPGLDPILELIRNATKDKAIDGLFVRIRGFSGGLGGAAMVQELRAEMERARRSGKKIVAYIEGSALGDEYYLASVADKIVAAPGSAIGGFGRSLEIYRLKGLYEKLGINWQVIAKGKYKTSFDGLSAEMTGEQKKMVERLVLDIHRQMINDIAVGRNIKVEKIKEIGDGMFFQAQLAKQMGLIDEVGYFGDANQVAAKLCAVDEEVKIIEPRLIEPEDAFFAQVFGVSVIEIDGEIVSGASGQNFIFGGSYVGSDKILDDIRKASDDLFVKAIVLRINSPGGSSVAAGEIYQALQYARSKKKVIIASMGDMAASGGYYIAAAADKIVADRSTITGSIGVIGSLPDYSELLKKIGVKAEVVKEGKYADMFSGLRKLSTVEVEAVKRIMEETYRDFIAAVAQGRKLPTAEVEILAEGKVYTGEGAKEVKLVDELGGFMDAVDLAKKEANIIGEPRLIYYREQNPFLQVSQGVSSALGLKQFIPSFGFQASDWKEHLVFPPAEYK